MISRGPAEMTLPIWLWTLISIKSCITKTAKSCNIAAVCAVIDISSCPEMTLEVSHIGRAPVSGWWPLHHEKTNSSNCLLFFSVSSYRCLHLLSNHYTAVTRICLFKCRSQESQLRATVRHSIKTNWQGRELVLPFALWNVKVKKKK